MKSIRTRIGLTLITVTAASIVGTVTAISLYLIADMHRSKAEELQLAAAIAGDRNAAALSFGDMDRAKENLEIFSGRVSVMSACLYDVSGVLVAGYTRDRKPVEPCQNIFARGAVPNGNFMTATQAIDVRDEPVGYLQVTADTSEINAFVKRLLFISGAAALGVFALFLPLIFRLQNTIARPILELTNTAGHITASGDYSARTPKRSDDEIGQLAEAFNAMIGETERRGSQLAEMNQSLEYKVQERTQELEAARARAEFASEAKSEFLRNMSHEFRTPLHAMTSYAAFGEREAIEGDRQKLLRYFRTIQAATGRLTRLVNEVLNISKLESGKQIFRMADTNLSDIIRHVLDITGALMPDKQLKFDVNLPDAPVTMVCDADRIGQVLINVIGNAVKFSPKDGTITIALSQAQDGNAIIAVRDEGVGIDEAEMESIFEPFVQGSRTNDGSGGTGLGLAISRRILDAHGGSISARNNTGGSGTTIAITLPPIAGGTETQQGKIAYA